MHKYLLCPLLISLYLHPQHIDIESLSAVEPNTQEIVGRRLDQLRTLIAQLQQHPAHTEEHAPTTNQALETIGAIEQGILQALTGNPMALAQNTQQALSRIQSPWVKVIIGGIFTGGLLIANQWVSCSVKK